VIYMKEHGKNVHRHRAVGKTQDKGLPPGLFIEPPPKEKGPEPLYRAVYVIDVNAADVQDAAQYTHRIMTDPRSLAPVLHILDHQGQNTTVDLATERPGVATPRGSDAAPEEARAFVRAGGAQCPACGGEDLDFDRVDVGAQCAYQECCCRHCEARFCAVYRLVGYGLHGNDSLEIHTVAESLSPRPAGGG
jgi:hypothetical protein